MEDIPLARRRCDVVGGVVVMYRHRTYSIGIDTVLIEGILQVLFSPAFFTVDICLDHVPLYPKRHDATVTQPKLAET